MNPQNLIVRYLDQARMMHIATAKANKPWCCTVYFAHDNLHNLYWISLPDTQHSQDIADNEQVAGTVVLPQNYGEPVHGLQFEGTARQVGDPDEVRQLIQAYSERYGNYSLAAEILSGDNKNQLYQIKPKKFLLLDVARFPAQGRQMWQLEPSTL